MRVELRDTVSMLRLKMLPFIIFLLTIGEVLLGHGDAHEFTTCLESDREALLAFKNSFEDADENPALSTWKGSNCCQWWGIRCENSTGAVTHVDLHNPRLEVHNSSNRYEFWKLSGKISP